MKYKLVAFDLDGVLIDLGIFENSWDLLRHEYNLPNCWKLFEEGKLSREDALDEYRFWREQGLTEDKINAVLQKHLRLNSSAKNIFAYLSKQGIATAIISEAPHMLVKAVADILKPKYLAYNEIRFNSKREPVSTRPTHQFDKKFSKAEALKDFAKQENVKLNECAAIGNSKNDAELFSLVGFSIAFNAKDEEIRKLAKVSVDNPDLKAIIPFL
jgi:HAD superfamily phosphoserine phosphatase-like hydrolase